MKVWLGDKAHSNSGGMYRVYDGLYNYLPKCGIEIVPDKNKADVIHAHIGIWGEIPDKPIIVSSHGMLWEEHNWGRLANKVNKECLESYRKADVVTAPSHFVARSISRYTGASPFVVHHGIDSDIWTPNKESDDFVLWNKSRSDSASNPKEMNELASLAPNSMFYSTYGEETENVFVFGNIDPHEMYEMVSRAGVYLSLSKESGGPCFGVLEAMSCAVPILAWNFGGTAEVIEHKETGYLAEPYNYEDLATGLQYCLRHRDRLGQAARQAVIENYTWDNVILGYVDAYIHALKGNNETVSVIIPCYNLGEFLPGCIDSVIEQTYDDLEIIVVDDASTDGSWQIVKDYAKKDSRIRAIKHAKNQHVSQTRNTGIESSTGKYILPLDADDRLYPDSIEKMVSRIDDYDIVAGKLHIYHESALEGPFQASGWPNNASLKLQLEGYNRLPYSSLYRRKVWDRVGGYRTRIRNGTEDADFWTRALSLGYKANIIDDYVLRYTHRENSLGKKNDKGSAVWLSWFPWIADNSPAMTTEVKNFSPPKVSVVIPVGPGHEKYIQACIDSLIAQTENDWEAIVVSDTGYPITFNGMGFVRFIDNDKNNGVAWARNRGIEAALSDKIVFLDVDDILQPHALQALLASYEYAGGWVYGDWYINKGDGNVAYSESEDWNYDKLLNRSLGPITGIYSKKDILAVGGFTEDISGWEDWDFHLKLLHIGSYGTRIKTPLITYNMHLGWRREENFNRRNDLLKYIHEKHYTTLKGKEHMACNKCGGKKTLTIKNSKSNESESTMEDVVQLEYLGYNTGRERTTSPNHPGTSYKYSASNRRFYVFKSDLDVLLSKRIPGTNDPLFKNLGSPVAEKTTEVEVEETPLVSEETPVSNPEISIRVLDLSDHVLDKLVKGGYEYIHQLDSASDSDLLAVKGIGDQRVTEIRELVAEWTS